MVQALTILSSSLGLLLVLLGFFAYQSFAHGMPRTEALQKKGSSKILQMWMMEFAYWLLRPLVEALVWCRIHPNTISWGSVFFAGFGAIALTKGYFGYGSVLSIIAFVLDAVDGMVARMTNMTSDAGAVLDSTLDRYTEFLFFAALMLYYRFEPLALGLVATALCGSWMVSYSSAKAEAMRVTIPRGTMRRPERLIVLVMGTVLAPVTTPVWEGNIPHPLHFTVLISVAFVAVFSNITAFYRVYHLYRRLAEKANQGREQNYPYHRKTAAQRIRRALAHSSVPTLVDFGILIGLVGYLKVHYLPSLLVSASAGTFVSYVLRHSWFFPKLGQKEEERDFRQEMVIAATSVIWNMLLVYGFVAWVETSFWLARILAAACVAIVWNWPMNSRFVFPPNKPTLPADPSVLEREGEFS